MRFNSNKRYTRLKVCVCVCVNLKVKASEALVIQLATRKLDEHEQ